MNQPVPPTTASSAPNHDDSAHTHRPLALDAHEPRPEVEDEVVALRGDRTQDRYAKLDRRVRDRDLRDRPFLIGSEHDRSIVAPSDNTASCLKRSRPRRTARRPTAPRAGSTRAPRA